MKKNSVLPRLLAPLCALLASAIAVEQCVAADFFVSSGPFSIRFADRSAPSEPVVVPVAPPAFFHPTASIYYETGAPGSFVDVVRQPDVLVAPTPKTVVYGPEHRTAPYLTAPQKPIERRPGDVTPRPVVVSSAANPSPWPGPYPVRPNNFRPNPYFGPGPHVPGPNHFGGMTPLGPGPAPSYGPH